MATEVVGVKVRTEKMMEFAAQIWMLERLAKCYLYGPWQPVRIRWWSAVSVVDSYG